MKIVLQAFITSLGIHLIYIVGMIVIGFIKTRNYKPDITGAWNKVEILQNEIAFGKSTAPFLYLVTFVGVSMICGMLLFLYKKFLN